MAEVGSLSGSAKHPTKLSENFLRQIDRSSSSSSNIYDVGRKLVWVENVWEKIVEKFFSGGECSGGTFFGGNI